MAYLTERQQNDLDKAVFHYLQSRGLSQSAAAFKEETSIEEALEARLDGILEKKWVAVIRLQKKVMDLESRVAQLQEEVLASPAVRAASAIDWVPKAPPRYTLAGHRAPVTRVAFHPVFSLLASASEDFTVKIWNWESGELERTLTGHTREVKDVDFNPSGTLLVSASSDLTIKLWDTSAWEKRGYSGISLYGHEHTISSARFLHNGDFIVSASRDKTIKVWEVKTKYCVRTIVAHDDWVRYVVPSEDDRYLVSCSNDDTARVWDYASGERKAELRGHSNHVEVVVFAPVCAYPYIRTLIDSKDTSTQPGAFAVTGARDKHVILWDAQTGRQLKELVGHDNWIRGLEFHPSGRFLLSVSDDRHMRVWELATGRCAKVVEAHAHFAQCVAWTPAVVGGGAPSATAAAVDSNGGGARKEQPRRRINALATGGGGTDHMVMIWTP